MIRQFRSSIRRLLFFPRNRQILSRLGVICLGSPHCNTGLSLPQAGTQADLTSRVLASSNRIQIGSILALISTRMNIKLHYVLCLWDRKTLDETEAECSEKEIQRRLTVFAKQRGISVFRVNSTSTSILFRLERTRQHTCLDKYVGESLVDDMYLGVSIFFRFEYFEEHLSV